MSEIYESIRQVIMGMAQAGTLPRSFEYAFVINALICALFIGPITGAVGTMVVVKRLAFFSQAVGQAALTGVAIGIVLGEPVDAPYVSPVRILHLICADDEVYDESHANIVGDGDRCFSFCIASGGCQLALVCYEQGQCTHPGQRIYSDQSLQLTTKILTY